MDRLAKEATIAAGDELRVAHEVRAEYLLIDDYITSLWQQQYSSSLTGAAYRALEPRVSGGRFVLQLASAHQMKQR